MGIPFMLEANSTPSLSIPFWQKKRKKKKERKTVETSPRAPCDV
jgi:hypothetical protein